MDSQTNTSSAHHSDCKSYLANRKQEVEEVLWSLLPPLEGIAAHLHKALRYPLEAGGKRIRPILVLAGADFCRGISGKSVYEGKSWEGIDPELKMPLFPRIFPYPQAGTVVLFPRKDSGIIKAVLPFNIGA